MLDGFIDPGSLGNVGAGGVVVLVVLLVLFGLLVPVRTLNREVEQERRRGDDWKAAYDVQDARADVQAAQLVELLELARTMHAVMQGMQSAAGRAQADRESA